MDERVDHEQTIDDFARDEPLTPGLPPLEALDAAEAFLAGRQGAIINEAGEVVQKMEELFRGSAMAWVLLSDETRAQQYPDVIPRLMRLARRFTRENDVVKPLVELLYVMHPEGGAESFAANIVELIELCLLPDRSLASTAPTGAATATTTTTERRFIKLPDTPSILSLQYYLEFVSANDPQYDPPRDVRARVPWPGYRIWLPHFDKLCDALLNWWIALADCDARAVASAGAAGSGARSGARSGEEASQALGAAMDATQALYILVQYDDRLKEASEESHVPRFGWRIINHVLTDLAAHGPSIFACRGLNLASVDTPNPEPERAVERSQVARAALMRTFDAAFALAPATVTASDNYVFDALLDLVRVDTQIISPADIVALSVAERCAALCVHLLQGASTESFDGEVVNGDVVLALAVWARVLEPPRARDYVALNTDDATRDVFLSQCRACDIFRCVARRVAALAAEDARQGRGFTAVGLEIPLIETAMTVDLSLVRIPEVIDTLFVRLLPSMAVARTARNLLRGLGRAQWGLRVLFDDETGEERDVRGLRRGRRL